MVACNPRAWPRCSGGKLFVRMAGEFANSIAAAMACRARKRITKVASGARQQRPDAAANPARPETNQVLWPRRSPRRSEEHTSELQSRLHLVCRLLLEKKNIT